MKALFLITGFILLSSSFYAQDDGMITFNLEDRSGLLSTLFDADSLNEYGEALWEPITFADGLLANISDDGWMHTRLDTLLFYEVFDIKKAVAVFETLHYEKGEVSDCQSCGAVLSFAIFEKNPFGVWGIERFAKHFTTLGAHGYGGEVGLAQFGENQTCLSLQMSWMGQGILAEYLTFLNLDNLERVFNLTIHEDNLGALGEDSDRAYSFDKAIHLLPSVETLSGWWEFDLVTQGTQPDNDVERALPANSVERYAYDWDTGTYMKVCR
ncbi:MAG TPA: hypothetical protein DCF33_17955 [Saprospirales bacterium]|nr:hypothetical protein [Saprospirales bacterium]